jgi:hypothetical protein
MSASRIIPHVSNAEAGSLPADAEYVIPPDRLPEALSRIEIINEFLEEIEALGLGTEPPRMSFDPSWEV